MKTIKRITFLTLVLVALFLAACGSGGSSNEEQSTTTGKISTESEKAREIREEVERKAKAEAKRVAEEEARIAKEREDSIAKVRADSLELARKDSILKRDDFEWTQAKRRNSIPALRRYIQLFPDGRHVAEANSLITQIEQRIANDNKRRDRQRDINTWSVANRQNTVSSYESYLRSYPRGVYSTQARNNLVQMKRIVRVTIQKLVCERSDDEGPNNDADMDRFSVKVLASQTECSPGKEKRLTQGNVEVYNYSGRAFQVQKGTITSVNKSIDLTFDSKNCKYPMVDVSFYARESDGSSQDEETTGAYRVTGGSYGNKSFVISTSDFTYRCYFNVSKVGW